MTDGELVAVVGRVIDEMREAVILLMRSDEPKISMKVAIARAVAAQRIRAILEEDKKTGEA